MVLDLVINYDADDYKVVRIDRFPSSEKIVIQTLVYSLKSGSWSIIESCPQYNFTLNSSVFLDGTLNWRSSNGIIALDLTTQSYFHLPEPSLVDKSRNCGLDMPSHLVAVDGCLIFNMCYRYNFDGWVMKDKLWTKLFSITSSLFLLPWNSNLVAYLKSKRQIVVQHDRCFLWFNIDDDNSVLKFSIHGFPRITSSQICSRSLVRLNACRFEAITATKTSTRKRKRKAKKTDPTRLKFCVRDVDDDKCANCLFDEDELFETSPDYDC